MGELSILSRIYDDPDLAMDDRRMFVWSGQKLLGRPRLRVERGSGSAEVDDQAAGENDHQTYPGRLRDRLLEQDAAGEDADHGEETYVRPEEPREIQSERVD